MTTEEKADVAPSVAELAKSKASTFVNSITDHVMGELRKHRDVLDEVIREHNERRNMVVDAIEALGAWSEKTMLQNDLMLDYLKKLMENTEASKTPLPGAAPVTRLPRAKAL